MKLSVYIIAFNEAEKIRECINSILWVDEIIVADSHSTDGTSEIAAEQIFAEALECADATAGR